MATMRSVMNNILRGLGEPELDDSQTQLTEDYQKQVALYLNFVKEEIEDAHQWMSLITEITATLTAGQTSVVLSNTTERSRVYYEHDEHRSEERPVAFDVTNSTDPTRLRYLDFPT